MGNEELLDDWMPICEVCGKPMGIVDVRAKAAAVGVKLPDEELYYKIGCCGYTMTIEDRKLYEKAIRNLLAYHGTK